MLTNEEVFLQIQAYRTSAEQLDTLAILIMQGELKVATLNSDSDEYFAAYGLLHRDQQEYHSVMKYLDRQIAWFNQIGIDIVKLVQETK